MINGRFTRFRAQTRLGSYGVLTSRQERFAMQLRGRLPDSRSELIIGDFWLSQLVQCLLDFCLGIVCSDEYGHVLHACSDETGKQPFTWRKL